MEVEINPATLFFLVLQTLKASEAATTSTRRRTGGAEVHPQPYLSVLCALVAHFFFDASLGSTSRFS